MSPPVGTHDVARTFLRWSTMRMLSFRGYWIVTSLYLVVVADLSAFQLVFLGTAMELTVLVSEVPTGVMADTISRKWSIAVSHGLMGTGMLVTGLVTDFGALVAAQMLWGFGWTFSSGADVAWATDELDDALRIDQVITARARWEQFGAALGMIAFGGLAWATSLATAIVVAGALMIVLGAFVVVRFTEHEFEPTREHRWRESREIFRRGAALARNDREILLVFAATMLVNSGAEAFDRLFPKRLVDLGFPEEPDPILWFTLLGVVTLTVGAIALRIVEVRIAGAGVAKRVYAAACLSGALGMIVLAHAPNELFGMAGVLLVGGVAWTVIRAVSVIWVNRRATSDVRATVQSFLGQTESFGEILGGLALGVLAQATTITVALTCSFAALVLAGLLVSTSR
ncbi:MAG: MFS transporter, partial [Ilumatobacter sp.]|uniref:MFS transporter n=1 Tax=Ilumatobacter sp. TaxID=1967498 RepID=UPI002627CABC